MNNPGTPSPDLKIPIPDDIIPHHTDIAQRLGKEQVSFTSQLFQILQIPNVHTIVSLAKETRGRVLSGIDFAKHIENNPGLGNDGVVGWSLYKFSALQFYTHVTKETPEVPIYFANTGRTPHEVVKEKYSGQEPERTVPDNLMDHVMEQLRKEGKISIDGGWPSDEKTRAMLKIRFSAQFFKHGGRMLAKVHHIPGNKIFASLRAVKSIEEIENEFLREGSNETFLWVDQAQFFNALSPK